MLVWTLDERMRGTSLEILEVSMGAIFDESVKYGPYQKSKYRTFVTFMGL